MRDTEPPLWRDLTTPAGVIEADSLEPSDLGPLREPVRPEPQLAGVDPRAAPARAAPRRGSLLVGVSLAVALAAAAGAAMLLRDRDDPAPAQPSASAGAEETGSVTEAGLYLPPDREAVRDAYAEVGRLYRTAGVSALAEAARACFADLAQRPTYRGLDYCSAVDAFGAAFSQRVAGAPPAANSWFGQSEERYLSAAGAVLGPERDAAARLVDIRRLAIEVARESGPAFATTTPSTPAPPAPAPSSVQVETVEPRPPVPPPASPTADQPAPTRRAQAAPAPAAQPGPAPRRTAQAEPRPAPGGPPRPVDREAYAAARGPEVGPTAAEVAAARPRTGRGPSFNCRRARSPAERLVCADPELSRLDRRLNAAFEDAIAAGADRRELRGEQDAWLAVREHAAPDPDAVADAYRRRIEELNARP